VIQANRTQLDILAKALLKEETLEEDAVKRILETAKLPKEATLHS
jgi:ATP-dependent Zn protease